MKVIIPVAGVGSRLKPHTFTTPKALLEVAGKPILEYIINDALKLNPSEIIFVVGHLKESIESFVKTVFPTINSSFIDQKVRDGDGSAIRLALEKFDTEEEVFVIFGDTMIDFEIKKSLTKNNSDAIIYTMPVEEPSHYGIVNYDPANMRISQVEEKPENPKSNLAIIGVYYFKSLLRLKYVLNELYAKKITIKGEYKLVQAIDKYTKDKESFVQAKVVNSWFDCGRPSVLLEANDYFLKKLGKGKITIKGDNLIIPPVYINKTAIIKKSIIGPNVSIGENACLENVIIEDSIICSDSILKNVLLKKSLIGKNVKYTKDMPKTNIGNNSEIEFE